MQERLCVLVAAAALSGCAMLSPTARPPEPIRVNVPIPIACVASIPVRPELHADRIWSETDNPDLRARALFVDRRLLLAHVGQLEAELTACLQ